MDDISGYPKSEFLRQIGLESAGWLKRAELLATFENTIKLWEISCFSLRAKFMPHSGYLYLRFIFFFIFYFSGSFQRNKKDYGCL